MNEERFFNGLGLLTFGICILLFAMMCQHEYGIQTDCKDLLHSAGISTENKIYWRQNIDAGFITPATHFNCCVKTIELTDNGYEEIEICKGFEK